MLLNVQCNFVVLVSVLHFYVYAFFEFKIKVRLWRSAWHGYQWCVRKEDYCQTQKTLNYLKYFTYVDCVVASNSKVQDMPASLQNHKLATVVEFFHASSAFSTHQNNMPFSIHLVCIVLLVSQ